MVKTKKNEHVNLFKKINFLCKEPSLTARIVKCLYSKISKKL